MESLTLDVFNIQLGKTLSILNDATLSRTVSSGHPEVPLSLNDSVSCQCIERGP